MEKILEEQNKDIEFRRIFEAYDDNMDGQISIDFLIEEFNVQGLRIMEEKNRFLKIQEYIKGLQSQGKTFLTYEEFKEILNDEDDGLIIEKALLGKLIIPDFSEFSNSIKSIYDVVETVEYGANADYIPQLAEVDPNLYAIAA